MTNPSTFDIAATCTAGFEPVLEQEVAALGKKAGVPVDDLRSGRQVVTFRGNNRTLYAANLHLRTAILVLRPVRSFQARSPEELYRNAVNFPWESILDPSATFAVTASVQSHLFPHSKYVALKVKDAVVDRIRERKGSRPSVDVDNPDLRLHVFIHEERAILSLDSSGAPLFKRGYRTQAHEASMNEALAAGLVLLSGWDGHSPFLDPMTGSGTIAIEAALIALRIAPGLFRDHFAFEKWPDYDEAAWNGLHARALEDSKQALSQSNSPQITAADSSPVAIDRAAENIHNAGLEGHIELITKPFDQLMPPSDHGMMVINPPYGERLHKADIDHFYEMIGDTLKQHFSGYTSWILSANYEALKHIGLQASKKIVLHNGPLECKFQRYDIYSGSRRSPGE